MSDALPIPSSMDLEAYEELANELRQACNSGDPAAVRDWALRLTRTVSGHEGSDHEADRVEQRWRKATNCEAVDTRRFLAQVHGFSNWPQFGQHVEELQRTDSPTSRFEAAADAIVTGDAASLAQLLRQDAELIRARSNREHRSTLLHYVSANGVEDFRQKTPKNIVEIARLLLEGGADVDAESDAYGGGSTTLGLTATSCHPAEAGVQIPLLELLIEYGAKFDCVNACIYNGRGKAAEFLAGRGARLDLEGAAGVGRLDVVESYFTDGALTASATRQQMTDAFAWACQFGRTDVVQFLLARGIAIDSKLKHHGQTGLHWAACGGHIATVELLLQHGSSVEARDDAFGGAPLGWALYGWANCPDEAEKRSYYEVVALLVQAGAIPDAADVEKVRSDPEMMRALRGVISHDRR